MTDQAPPNKPRGVVFDRTINLGHVLTFVGFLITAMVAWSTMDKRVVVLEEGRKAQAQIDRHQDETVQANMATIREQLTEIRRSVEKIADRQERRP